MAEDAQIVDRTVRLHPRVPKSFEGGSEPLLGPRIEIQWAVLHCYVLSFCLFQVSVHAGSASSSFDGLGLR